MNILIISNLYPNRLEQNKATFNRQQFFELSHRCSVKIIAPIAWTDRIFLKYFTKRSIPAHETIDGIETYHPTYFFIPKVFSFLYGFFYFLSIYVTSVRQIRSMRPDCIFATWAFPDGFAAVLVGRIHRIPVFIKIHGSDIHSIESRLRSVFTAWGLKKARKVFSVSKKLTLKMNEMGVEKSNIITNYNGVDRKMFFPLGKIEARKKFNLPLDKIIILYVGNFETVKGPDVLIEAFEKIKCDKNNWTLYLTGKGSLLRSLKKKSYTYDGGKSIVFSGPVAHENMGAWMNIADLLIVPSRNEGVPNVILEAMACGIPVVATKVGGIPEVVIENETGILVEQDSPDELAIAIEGAIKKKWDRAKILTRADRYTWGKNASSIIESMQKCS